MLRTTPTLAALAAALLLAGCGDGAREASADAHGHAEGAGEADHDSEKGPQGGRLLRSGDFALELLIYEAGASPEFHAYAYRKGKPVSPEAVKVEVELTRLDGEVDRVAFAPQGDFLRGLGAVEEPHSFDVKVRASEGGRSHRWTYGAYEGRTTLTPEAAAAGGVRTEVAGPTTMPEIVEMAGRVEITPEGQGEVRAWYPGRVMSMTAKLGETVRKGQVLARVESSSSLQTYSIPAPISGVVIQKGMNVGDVTYERPLYVIADPDRLHAEFFVYPRDAERVREGQKVEVRTLSGETRVRAPVEAVVPVADLTSQTLRAHVHLPPGASQAFKPGMGVEGAFEVASRAVPLAVRTRAIQRFRDAEAVFVRVGDTYEARLLDLGRRTPEWTEVLGGLKPGAEYVTDGAFLIRADIEKSGAAHSH
ncbi:HlyD family efflux transporter periplasmic adaptor subunit [Phenylobacterium sp. SCN 70-31]|uniref:efflux RND transporter periplasmic adaptor subunit n=1 Tax=Phenylobacterium sp. SCN 70-31 TaxID=1660129 RepID=UPI0008687FE4|nr:HlyD family efflux transporter periplasmic adaptor subunit [Phenylobacterium sp. SCN 70-31]ODT89423.1 MAG: cation transporter [Phenylobacterium sp. SCN 70-31]